MTTAPARDRLLDHVRALSLGLVVLGHWLVGGLGYDGAVLRSASPLATMPWAAPLTWLVAVLGLFLCVGGRLSVESWDRAVSSRVTARTSPARAQGAAPLRTDAPTRTARRRGQVRVWRSWIGRRLGRLGGPLVPAVGAIGLVLVTASAVGVPGTTLATLVKTMAQPLWFLGVYLLLTVATPVLAWLDRRWGLKAVATMAAMVAVIDLVRFGPLGETVPSWFAWLSLAPGWAFAFQLGVWWSGRQRRDGRSPVPPATVGLGLLVVGAASLVALMGWAGYPVSMVGGGGVETRSATHPPTLTLLALEAVVVGALWRWEAPLRRFFDRRATNGTSEQAAPRRPAARRLSGRLGSLLRTDPVGVLVWHQAAALLPVLALAALAPGVPVLGLTTAPTGPGWLLARLCWMPLFAVVLALVGGRHRPRGRLGSQHRPTPHDRRVLAEARALGPEHQARTPGDEIGNGEPTWGVPPRSLPAAAGQACTSSAAPPALLSSSALQPHAPDLPRSRTERGDTP